MAEKRKRKTKQEMQEEYNRLSDYLNDNIYTAKYIGKEILGFKKGKQYAFKLTKPINECYQLKELEDGLYITYASSISIRQNWKDIKEDN